MIIAISRIRMTDQVSKALRVDFLARSASHQVRGLMPRTKKVIMPERLMQMMLVMKSRKAKNES